MRILCSMGFYMNADKYSRSLRALVRASLLWRRRRGPNGPRTVAGRSTEEGGRAWQAL